MRDAYRVEKIRAAEATLMAQLPEGTLMQRAAAGLASVCAGVLRTAQGGGRIYGSRVVVLAGTGDNGGDALYAGALLARRGAAVTAILAGSNAHPGGRDALRAAGGRILAIVPWAAGGTAPQEKPGQPAPGEQALGGPAQGQPGQPPASQPPPPAAATRVDLPELPTPDAAAPRGPAPAGAAPTRQDLPRVTFEPARAVEETRPLVAAGPSAAEETRPLGSAPTGAPGAADAAGHEASDLTRPDIGRVARFTPGHDVRRAIGYADLIIDGLLGIGGKGGLREPYATLAQYAANSTGVTVAVDLPSGIDADTGAVEGPAVRADVTVTFGALKPGLLVDPAARHAGVVELIDIGLRPHLERPDVSAPQASDIAALVPKPGPESDKYRRGVVGLLVGSERFTGAALLATGGAVRGGAGMVRLITAQRAADAVRLDWPEVVIMPVTPDLDFPDAVGRVQAWTAGPGMGLTDDAAQRLTAVLKTGLPVLVDADGLALLSRQPGLLPRSAPTLLTPHAGELGRLLDADPADVERHRLHYARAAARKFGACVLLKGSTTVIAQPGDREPVLVNTTGTPWLATAGTGDVLSGLAGALLAQGLLPPQAAITAAYLHGLAARLAASSLGLPADGDAGVAAEGEAPLGASDVLRALPLAFRSL